MESVRITSKRQMFEMLARGEFGNSPEIAFEFSDITDFAAVYMVRYLSPGKTNFLVRISYDVNTRDFYICDLFGRKISWPSNAILQKVIKPIYYQWNFEVGRLTTGLDLRFSADKEYAKNCVWKERSGLVAKEMLKQKLGEDYESIIDLVDRYDAVVEGVICNTPQGKQKQNLVIWEVRSY